MEVEPSVMPGENAPTDPHSGLVGTELRSELEASYVLFRTSGELVIDDGAQDSGVRGIVLFIRRLFFQGGVAGSVSTRVLARVAGRLSSAFHFFSISRASNSSASRAGFAVKSVIVP